MAGAALTIAIEGSANERDRREAKKRSHEIFLYGVTFFLLANPIGSIGLAQRDRRIPLPAGRRCREFLRSSGQGRRYDNSVLRAR
jgi:hypothetical protein